MNLRDVVALGEHEMLERRRVLKNLGNREKGHNGVLRSLGTSKGAGIRANAKLLKARLVKSISIVAASILGSHNCTIPTRRFKLASARWHIRNRTGYTMLRYRSTQST